ncbi:serine/threonine-protein kinase rio1 [Holotrichia oblita]|uniref:Serine/threonine-protein kinase rio1 n=1 Tax=Holotrichia oblita TaxID=644536 RepID=A0ACB9TAD6_HOLOL|nr:serine/threonine-protein kinase rio1 [Holotrichia oblita]
MVRTWAEKEMRNLVRMHTNGVNVPEPVLLRSHVLVMDFIGKDGWPAPLLKDAEISQSKSREVYREVIVLMWKMYNNCKLVHADLSEFNMLYQDGNVYIIDVSQSVEHDHPHALDFLRKDCTNITEFFRKKEVATMNIKQLFDFITDPHIDELNLEEHLDRLSEQAGERLQEEITSKEQVDEEVFKNAYIPKRLTEVVDAERDITLAKSNGVDNLVYKTITGLKIDSIETKKITDEPENSSDEDDGSNTDSDCSSENEGSRFVNCARPKHETTEEKKERKKAIKEQQAEKRKFEDVYKSSKLQNWQIPKWYPERPCTRKGKTRIIANDRGHLLPDIPRTRKNMWGEFTHTWDLPKKITRKLANELSAPKPEKLAKWNKHCSRHELARSAKNKENLPINDKIISVENELIKDEKQPDEEEHKEIEVLKQNEEMDILKDASLGHNRDIAAKYTPGDVTDPKDRDPSHLDLKAGIFDEHAEEYPAKGYPKYRNDFSAPLPKKMPDLKTQVDDLIKKHQEMSECSCPVIKKKTTPLPSPYLAAAKNFILARKLHTENLEHVPLPDTITDAMYRKRQMMGDSEPGLMLKDGNFATGVGWKGYPGYGATRCTKLKVYRPKTCSSAEEAEKVKDDRPNSVSSFDKKWRFIRQTKVTPIELAICWDLTPVDPTDEPKRTKHIDGSNGSQAPAVFSLVHTPKGDLDDEAAAKTFIPLFDKVNAADVEHKCHRKDCKTAWEAENRVVTSSHKSNSSNNSNNNFKRSKSAYNLNHHSHHSSEGKTSSTSSAKKTHKSSPNLTNPSSSYKYCSKECLNKSPSKRLCVACELKNVKLKERPKSEFKMAFKAGVPNNNKSVSLNNELNPNRLKIPKQRDPYSNTKYHIETLAPPFSFQSGKRHEYPNHWRLASIYQHSYKPLHLRKRPMIECVFK